MMADQDTGRAPVTARDESRTGTPEGGARMPQGQDLPPEPDRPAVDVDVLRTLFLSPATGSTGAWSPC